jgi:transketolase
MRKQFAEKLHREMGANENIYFLTGDLGYGLWDKIKIDYPDRFYNCGSSEQLMLGIASGLAMEGKVPVVYSITPFLLYRPFEFIRNYVNHEKLPVKLIGGGRNRDYGYLGFSHWAEEDKKVMACFKNIKTIHPTDLEHMHAAFKDVLDPELPVYMNLKRK